MALIPAHELIRHLGRRHSVTEHAPGRINLIGEHTDYNGGFVLPTVTPMTTSVAVAANPDDQVRAFSHALPYDAARRRFTIGQEQRQHNWIDYIQGATTAMRGAGLAIGGFDVVVCSDLPLGSGLSSSAALLVSLMRALRSLFQLQLDERALAALARRAEADFLGIPVGPMDPLACTLGRRGYALFLDTRSLETQLILMPAGMELAVVNSGIRHEHVSGAYGLRQQECQDAAARIGVASLREVTAVHTAAVDALPDPLNRRVRHVVSENARVLQAVTALRDGNPARLGLLMDASHVSLRDDYEVSLPAIDALVARARATRGVLGARMTGGGFGGAIVVLTLAGQAKRVATEVAAAARSDLSLDATALVPA